MGGQFSYLIFVHIVVRGNLVAGWIGNIVDECDRGTNKKAQVRSTQKKKKQPSICGLGAEGEMERVRNIENELAPGKWIEKASRRWARWRSKRWRSWWWLIKDRAACFGTFDTFLIKTHTRRSRRRRWRIEMAQQKLVSITRWKWLKGKRVRKKEGFTSPNILPSSCQNPLIGYRNYFRMSLDIFLRAIPK